MTFLAGPAALLAGPHRAVLVLCLTQILGWGALFYPPALTMSHVAAEHQWTLAQALFGFSIALGTSGLVAPYACGLIDRHGGNPVMAAGALIGALGLLLLPFSRTYPVYVVAWLLIGVSIASCLYDPAFTTLTRIYGMNARRPITLVTFAGGLSSTVTWPFVHFLLDAGGWHLVYYVLAAIFAFVVAPLHFFALPRHSIATAAAETSHATSDQRGAEPRHFAKASGWPFILIAAGFAGHAFVLSGTTTHLLAILQRGGIDAASAVTIGALFGPAQVVTRLADFVTKGRLHPIWVARTSMAVMLFAFATLALVGIAPLTAVAFAILFGASNGVMTIARGSLPLAVFGPTGYGRIVGRISRPGQLLQAFAPFALAYVIDRWSDQMALEILAGILVVALLCFASLRRT